MSSERFYTPLSTSIKVSDDVLREFHQILSVSPEVLVDLACIDPAVLMHQKIPQAPGADEFLGSVRIVVEGNNDDKIHPWSFERRNKKILPVVQHINACFVAPPPLAPPPGSKGAAGRRRSSFCHPAEFPSTGCPVSAGPGGGARGGGASARRFAHSCLIVSIASGVYGTIGRRTTRI